MDLFDLKILSLNLNSSSILKHVLVVSDDTGTLEQKT